MSKRQLIDEIRQFNPTARQSFLEQFDEQALDEYLRHLKDSRRRGTRIAAWVRPARKLKAVC